MEKTFGTIIKEARKSRNLSQSELAILCHSNGAEISRIENGLIKKPAQDLVINLCIQLNLNQKEVFDLLGYKEIRKPYLEKNQEYFISQLNNFPEKTLQKIYIFLDLISRTKSENDLEIIYEFLQNFSNLSEKDKSIIRLILSQK